MISTKVYFVDDDELILNAVSRLLRRAGFDVSTFLSAAELLEDLQPDAIGCILTDLNMPEMNGLMLQDTIKKSVTPLPIVFLSGSSHLPHAVEAMRNGAVDFITKSAPIEQLIAAIQRAITINNNEIAERARKSTIQKTLALLSHREREVLEHVMQGSLNKQIANALGIHERTVKLHRTSIAHKLGLFSVAQLTKFWIEANSSTEN